MKCHCCKKRIPEGEGILSNGLDGDFVCSTKCYVKDGLGIYREFGGDIEAARKRLQQEARRGR
jgi:hypothetical protein